MVTEEIGYKMEVLEDGQIQCCQVTHVMKDGVEIAKTLHRHVLAPGDKTDAQDARVAAVATAVWDKDTVDKYAAAKAAREAAMTPKG